MRPLWCTLLVPSRTDTQGHTAWTAPQRGQHAGFILAEIWAMRADMLGHAAKPVSSTWRAAHHGRCTSLAEAGTQAWAAMAQTCLVMQAQGSLADWRAAHRRRCSALGEVGMQECGSGLGLGVARVVALKARPLVEVVAPIKAPEPECAVLKVNELHGRRNARLCPLIGLLRAADRPGEPRVAGKALKHNSWLTSAETALSMPNAHVGLPAFRQALQSSPKLNALC